MTGNKPNSAATHLGRQMKRDRQAHGWSLRELSARTGIDYATLSRIENGKRPPTEKLAAAWRKSTYSGSDGGSCVEVGQDGLILVRDTTDRDGGTLAFPARAWAAFAASLK